MELKDKKSQQEKSKYKLHTKSPLCKKWQENTLKKSETLKIIKLSKKNLNNLLRQTNKKPNLEEKMQIMSMLCLLLDSSIPLSTKKMFIDGAKNISPMVNFFKKVFLNFIEKNIVKKTIIKEKNEIINKDLSKKGLLNWSLIEIFDKALHVIAKFAKNFYFATNNIFDNISKKNLENPIFKKLFNQQAESQNTRKEKLVRQKHTRIEKDIKNNKHNITSDIAKNTIIDKSGKDKIKEIGTKHSQRIENKAVQEILSKGSKSKDTWSKRVVINAEQSTIEQKR